MFKAIIISFLSLSVFAECNMAEYDIQKTAITQASARFNLTKDKKIKIIRRIEFKGRNRLRFLYVNNKGSLENKILSYTLSDNCSLSFK